MIWTSSPLFPELKIGPQLVAHVGLPAFVAETEVTPVVAALLYRMTARFPLDGKVVVKLDDELLACSACSWSIYIPLGDVPAAPCGITNATIAIWSDPAKVIGTDVL